MSPLDTCSCDTYRHSDILITMFDMSINMLSLYTLYIYAYIYIYVCVQRAREIYFDQRPQGIAQNRLYMTVYNPKIQSILSEKVLNFQILNRSTPKKNATTALLILTPLPNECQLNMCCCIFPWLGCKAPMVVPFISGS